MNTRKDELNIVFMGTPAFAVDSLDEILRNGHHVAGVVTVPDKPAGRGRKVTMSAIKRYALDHRLPLLQPTDLSEPSFTEELKAWNPHIIVVVAYRMLPEVVWSIPSMGTFNLHASLLPQYRGAAPINRVIMNGEKNTGITTFFIDHHLDTGHIILQESMDIRDDETAGELHDRMKVQGAKLVAKTIGLISGGQAIPIPQWVADTETLKKAPKIFKEETYIDWNKPAREIYNHIRGLSPTPCATGFFRHAHLGRMGLRIYKASFHSGIFPDPAPGLLTDGKSYIRVSLQDGLLELLDIQLSDRKRMLTRDFLMGYPLSEGWEPDTVNFQPR